MSDTCLYFLLNWPLQCRRICRCCASKSLVRFPSTSNTVATLFNTSIDSLISANNTLLAPLVRSTTPKPTWRVASLGTPNMATKKATLSQTKMEVEHPAKETCCQDARIQIQCWIPILKTNNMRFFLGFRFSSFETSTKLGRMDYTFGSNITHWCVEIFNHSHQSIDDQINCIIFQLLFLHLLITNPGDGADCLSVAPFHEIWASSKLPAPLKFLDFPIWNYNQTHKLQIRTSIMTY